MGRRKIFTGTVVSDKMKKTIVVKVMSKAKHPKYGRIIKKFTKLKAHDESNTAKIGDMVSIQETRPLSKDKNFKLIKVIKKDLLSSAELKE